MNELLEGVRRNDDRSFELLAEKYAALTESMVRRFAPSFGISAQSGKPVDCRADGGFYDFDDLRQYASVALYKAAAAYDPSDRGREVSFGLYAKICIGNAMITELRRHKRRLKKSARRAEVSVTANSSDMTDNDPIMMLAYRTELRGKLEIYKNELSAYEREVFDQYIMGKSVHEIAVRLGKNEKSVSNALYRMKVKIRGLLREQ